MDMPADGRRAASADGPVEACVGTRRVLLVEDDPLVRLVCSVNLRLAGFEVAEAGDGQRGLEQAQLEPPDLVVSDIRMPGLDGFALAEALRRDERTRAVPIVFLSGETEAAERRRAYAIGASGFVAKPFDPVALVKLLAGVIEKVAAGRRLLLFEPSAQESPQVRLAQ